MIDNRRVSVALLSAALITLASACGPAEPPPDFIVLGRIWTGDSAAPWAQGVAIRGDRIIALGDRDTITALAGSGTVTLDNGANLVTPGLQDDHTHFFAGGFQLVSVELRDAATPEEFIRRVGTFAQTLPEGAWILGGNWDHESWTAEGTPLPRAEWIDSVTGTSPVFVNRLDGHMALANSAAIRLAGVTSSTPTPPGGEIVRDRNGEPTGVFKDAAMDLVASVIPAPSAEQLDSALAGAMRHAASVGVTAVSHVSASWEEVAALRRARDQGRLSVRVSVYTPLAGWREAAESLRVNGPGDEWLRVAGVKGFVDGSLGSTTALFEEPYTDARRTSGLFVTPEDSLRAWIGAADSAGLQVAVHAIGDRANAILLGIYDSVARAHGPRDRRFRIEHAQHLRLADIEWMARLSVIASMQPYHAIDDGRWAEKRIGRDRIQTTYAFRSLLDAGAELAFGSDWPVAPLRPAEGLYAAVTRRTLDDRYPEGWVPAQRLTLEEALQAYTSGNAHAAFREGNTGVLRVGALADLVLFDRDLFQVPSDQIREVVVRATVTGGVSAHGVPVLAR